MREDAEPGRGNAKPGPAAGPSGARRGSPGGGRGRKGATRARRRRKNTAGTGSIPTKSPKFVGPVRGVRPAAAGPLPPGADAGFPFEFSTSNYSDMNMEYRTLGRTGLRVSAVSLGCEGFMGLSPEDTCSLMDAAMARGVNFMDLYSPNPDLRRRIGQALRGRRSRFVLQAHLCTVWEDGQYLRTRDPEKTRASFEEALRLLETDYVDVGMVHYVDDERDLKAVLEGPVMQMAEAWKREGRIRHIGLSSHNPVVAQQAVRSGRIDVLLFSINPCYDLQPASEEVEDLWAEKSYDHPLQNIDPDREALYELCEREGVGIDVMKVYGGGDLLNAARSPFGRAFTPAQCIEYALTRPAVAAVMVGCHSMEELDAATAWCGATARERDYTDVMRGLEQFSWRGHCMYCGHCAPCTAGIDIASVNKFYNLTEAEGCVPETVREHYKLLRHHASECLACGQCEERCPFGVNIREQMRLAAERFGY